MAKSCTRAYSDTGHKMTRALAGPSPHLPGVIARLGASLALPVALLPAPALAAGGGDVSPFVYQFRVCVIAIFVGS